MISSVIPISCPPIFWFPHPIFLTSLRQCMRHSVVSLCRQWRLRSLASEVKSWSWIVQMKAIALKSWLRLSLIPGVTNTRPSAVQTERTAVDRSTLTIGDCWTDDALVGLVVASRWTGCYWTVHRLAGDHTTATTRTSLTDASRVSGSYLLS